MNATVAWSYQLLAPDEQRAFRRLGALPGGFRSRQPRRSWPVATASSAGSDDALGAVAGLIDKSLLLRAETSVATRPLYQMLETVRAYAALELAAAGERDDALEGLVRYCTREAALAAEGLVGPAQGEWLDRVRDDLESYRGALAWLIEQRPPHRSVRHRLAAGVLLADSRARGRRAPVVRTDSAPADSRAGCRVESARRRGRDAVHAGENSGARTRALIRALRARP